MLQPEDTSTPSRPLSTDDRTSPEPRNETVTNDESTEYLDADSLRALQNRDPAAVERWIYSHRSLIYGFLIKMVNDEEVARELVQETFYQALRSLPQFRGASKVATWLCSVAKHTALTYFRSRSRYTTRDPKSLERLGHTGKHTVSSYPPRSPRDYAQRSERKEIVHAALGNLPASYQQIIRLRDLQERSTQEAASELDITNVNVRVRLHRARKRLKSLLAPLLSVGYRLAD